MPGFVIALLVGLVVFPPLFASGTMREAFRLTFSAPAWLVPAAFSFVTALFYREFGRGVREHVFTQSDLPAGFLCAFLFTIGVAGQIGMLRARDAGRPADSVAFLTGLREHGAALYAGKLLIMLATTAVFRTLGRRGESVFADLLCLVPNVLLVGLVGTCAVHPKSVFHAIFAALGAGVRMPGLGRIVLAQTIALAAFGALAGGNQFRDRKSVV